MAKKYKIEIIWGKTFDEKMFKKESLAFLKATKMAGSRSIYYHHYYHDHDQNDGDDVDDVDDVDDGDDVDDVDDGDDVDDEDARW